MLQDLLFKICPTEYHHNQTKWNILFIKWIQYYRSSNNTANQIVAFAIDNSISKTLLIVIRSQALEIDVEKQDGGEKQDSSMQDVPTFVLTVPNERNEEISRKNASQLDGPGIFPVRFYYML